MRVLAISGSLRRASHNTRLLRVAAQVSPPAKLEVFEGLKDVPPYDADEDVDPAPEAVRRLRQAVADADALLIATPEYNSSLPGQLKNALDWASRPFPDNVLRNEPVAVIGASTGAFGAVWAQAEARKVLAAAGARVIDVELPVAGAEQAFDGDRLADLELHRRLAEIVERLIEAARERRERAPELPVAA
jgi:chromate reductase, NAD(P)H dehydrogenase (quinone)